SASKAELGAGERGVTDAASQARRCAGEKDAAPATRQHVTGGLASGEKSRVAAHFPHFAEHAPRGFEQRKIYIRADVEDADFERRMLVGVGEERHDFLFLARIERARDDA